MIIEICLQIYNPIPFLPIFFLHFHRKGIIFPSTRFLLCLTGNKNNTINNNKAPNGTPSPEVEDVPY